MPSSLMGSAPQASFSTQPTILPEQRSLLDSLLQALQGGAYSPGVGAGAGAGAQQTSLQGMENIASGVGSQGTLQPGSVAGALTNSLTPNIPQNFAPPVGQAPQIGAQPQVSPNAIDSTQAFQQGVVAPITQDFLTRTLPGIAGHYGQGAGGAFSSDALAAREQAGTDTTRALAQQGTQFAYDAARANQQASLTSQLANQSTHLQEEEFNVNQDAATQAMNIESLLRTNQLNQGGAGANQSAILQALGLAPSVNTLPFGPATADAGLFQALLQGSGMPFTQNLQLLTAMLGGSTQGTQTTTGVGTGGSSGILPGLFQAGGAIGAAALSDERLKEDFELVGEVGGFPLYKYRFKGEPKNVVRVGVKAQEVEKKLPSVIGRVPGTDLRTVNYSGLIQNALEAA